MFRKYTKKGNIYRPIARLTMNQVKRAQIYRAKEWLSQVEMFKILIEPYLSVILNRLRELLKPRKQLITQQWMLTLAPSLVSFSQHNQQSKKDLQTKRYKTALTSVLKLSIHLKKSRNKASKSNINSMVQQKEMQLRKTVKQAGQNLEKSWQPANHLSQILEKVRNSASLYRDKLRSLKILNRRIKRVIVHLTTIMRNTSKWEPKTN